MNEQQCSYYAFISYNSVDEKWAKWLHYNLEYYHIPSALCKEYPGLPKKIRPIFWYKQDLSGTKLNNELSSSKYLIVICSPNSAKADWVNDEVIAFIEQGKGDRIIPFIVAGTPHAKNPDEECFPPALRNLTRDEEIRGIYVRRKEGKYHALVDVIATMFGVRFDVLWQRHERRRKMIRFDMLWQRHMLRRKMIRDEVEKFATSMARDPEDAPSTISPDANITDEVESYCRTMGFSENKLATYNATIQKRKESIWCKLFGNKYNEVYSSIFAPAEVKRKSHLQVQVYLHLYEESEKVKSLALESDKNAERRDYIPLSLKLKKGDKVDVEFNVYGETRLMSERKFIIWQGSFTKCSFDYFVPNNLDVDELSCVANIFVNGAMIGEMRFLTQIVETPRNLNPEILSHRFNRIFISYAHQDAQQIKLLALAYKAQGVDYFYDRDSLASGDVYEEKIFDYIDSSDLFVLCWSKNAAVSDYVAKEKGRALLRAYPQISQREATLKICPISIEPRADLPSDMKEVYNFEVI